MNLYQQFFAMYNELLNKSKQLKETQELKQILIYLQNARNDVVWYNDVNSFIESLFNKYPAIRYYIEKHRDGRQGIPDCITMADYLVIAGMCIITDLYVETYKNR